MFHDWLAQQRGRDDAVGQFATAVLADRARPRSNRLYLYLVRYAHDPALRAAAKVAHREWRAARRVEAIA